MKKIAEYVKWYLYITTCILIVCTVIIVSSGEENIRAATLWQILLSGLLTTWVTVAINVYKCTTRRSFLFHVFLHYAALCAVMIVCGTWFGWMQLDLGGILMMVVSVAVVYLLCVGAYSVIDQRQADNINRKLKEKYGED